MRSARRMCALGHCLAAGGNQRESDASRVFSAAGRAGQLAAHTHRQQHGRRSDEQHWLSDHGSVCVEFRLGREHLRRDAEQWKQLYGSSHIHSGGGRPTRGRADRDFLDSRRYSSPGPAQRHRSSRLRNRHQPGRKYFHAAGARAGQRCADCDRSPTPATLPQPASRFLCRRRSASLRTPAAPCWGPAPVARGSGVYAQCKRSCTGALTVSSSVVRHRRLPRPSPESAALPVRSSAARISQLSVDRSWQRRCVNRR